MTGEFIRAAIRIYINGMIVNIYTRSKDDPVLLVHTETKKVYTMEDLDKIKADYKSLAPENDSDKEIIKELERQGRIGDETSMHPDIR